MDIAFDYRGRRVLVTGGTGGIGKAVARAYQQAGAEVWVTGTRKRPDSYDVLPDGIHYRQFNVERPGQAESLAEEFEYLDMLVDCVGVAVSGSFDRELQPVAFARALQVNLLGFHRLAFALHGALARSPTPGGASIVAMASLTSFFGNGAVPGYGAAKAGLVQLCKTLAIAWAADGIRVNAIAAGLTETPMTAGHLVDQQALLPFLQRTPLGRVGQPADMVGPILFLTSCAAGYITGQTVLVDGGYSVQG